MTTIAERPADELVHPGRTKFGTIRLSDRVVAKLAAQAITEVRGAGASTPRLLGRAVGARIPGVHRKELGAQPKVSVDLDLSVATVELSISVRWPASVPGVTAAVRGHVMQRLTQLTGLTITEVRIAVTDLITDLDSPPRVR